MPNDAPMQPPVPYLVTGEESQGLICGYQFITGQAVIIDGGLTL